MKYLQLRENLFTEVDNSEHSELSKIKWSVNGMGRAHRKTSDKKTIYLHRQIMNPPRGLVVDHLDGNPLNNRKSNLRICTQAENLKNKRLYKNNTSGVKGITWDKARNKWSVRIYNNGNQQFMGYFVDLAQAKQRLLCQ